MKVGTYPVEYATESRTLTVDAVEELPSHIADCSSVRVMLRNNSTSETVTTVVLSLVAHRPYYTDFAGGRPMTPGATNDGLILVHQPGESHDRVIRVNAVLFDNGTKPEGDPAAIEYIRYARLGELAESMRILPL